MKVTKTITFENARGEILNDDNKKNHILVVGSIHKIGQLVDDQKLFIGGGIIGSMPVTQSVVDAHDYSGIQAYTVGDLLNTLSPSASDDLDIADYLASRYTPRELHSMFESRRKNARPTVADPFVFTSGDK